MIIFSAPDYNGMSRKAANLISAQVILKPDSVLGLATGSTPLGVYAQLIDWYNKGDVDFSKVLQRKLGRVLRPCTGPRAKLPLLHEGELL